MKRVRGVKTWRSPMRCCWRMKKRSGWIDVQVVLGARHRDVEQPALLLDLGGRAGREVRRDAAVGGVEHEDRCPTPAPSPSGSSTGSGSPRRGAGGPASAPVAGRRIERQLGRGSARATAQPPASCSSCSRSPSARARVVVEPRRGAARTSGAPGPCCAAHGAAASHSRSEQLGERRPVGARRRGRLERWRARAAARSARRRRDAPGASASARPHAGQQLRDAEAGQRCRAGSRPSAGRRARP